jgi:hypothetical protein
MASEKINESHRHGRLPRHWARYRMRTLMGVVLSLGCGLAWFEHRASIQRRAVTAITRAGGAVSYDLEVNLLIPSQYGRLNVPRWLVDLVGIDHFCSVIDVDLWAGATDKELRHVGQLPRLKRLVVHSTMITDAGLSYLSNLTSLGLLEIDGTQISNAGLAHLKRLTRLYALSLVGTKVTDDGLSCLKGLWDLQVLRLPEGVSDDGIRELEEALPSTFVARGFPGSMQASGADTVVVLRPIAVLPVLDFGLAEDS